MAMRKNGNAAQNAAIFGIFPSSLKKCLRKPNFLLNFAAQKGKDGSYRPYSSYRPYPPFIIFFINPMARPSFKRPV